MWKLRASNPLEEETNPEGWLRDAYGCEITSGHLSHLLLEEEAVESAVDVESGELKVFRGLVLPAGHLRVGIWNSLFLVLRSFVCWDSIRHEMDFSLSSIYCHLMLGQRMKKEKQCHIVYQKFPLYVVCLPRKIKSQVHANVWIWIKYVSKQNTL